MLFLLAQEGAQSSSICSLQKHRSLTELCCQRERAVKHDGRSCLPVFGCYVSDA